MPHSLDIRTGQEQALHGGAVWDPRAPGALPAQAMPEHAPAARPDTPPPASRWRTRVPWETAEPGRTSPAQESGTLAGEWTVMNTVEETTYPAFQHLRLQFHLVIRQHRDTFEAAGEKYPVVDGLIIPRLELT